MPEPSSSGAGGAALVAIAASLVGARYGPLVTVLTAASIGAFISLGEVGTKGGRVGALAYLLGYTGAAAATAGTISYLIERYTTVPAIEVLAAVAFCIGWIGGRWQSLLNAALAAAGKLIGSAADRAGRGGR